MKWPFTLQVEHNLARNTRADNIIIELTAADGAVGYGEGVARPYVTGETTDRALTALTESLLPRLLAGPVPDAYPWPESDRLPDATEADQTPAAVCALETALLDLVGRRNGQPLSRLLGDPTAYPTAYPADDPVVYCGILPLAGPRATESTLVMAERLELKQIKIKVGPEGGVERVGLVRRRLGPEVGLRVDANGAWTAEAAIEQIGAMTRFNIEAVEQPTAKGDLAGLAKVTAAVEPLILADESICTPHEAEELIRNRAVGGFNLRLSKCGGPSRTGAILRRARRAGLVCQLGCQVGELGVLSALGRHFAAANRDLVFLEGSVTHYLYGRDVIKEDLSFGLGGKSRPINASGLGVSVDQAALEDCLVARLN